MNDGNGRPIGQHAAQMRTYRGAEYLPHSGHSRTPVRLPGFEPHTEESG